MPTRSGIVSSVQKLGLWHLLVSHLLQRDGSQYLVDINEKWEIIENHFEEYLEAAEALIIKSSNGLAQITEDSGIVQVCSS